MRKGTVFVILQNAAELNKVLNSWTYSGIYPTSQAHAI